MFWLKHLHMDIQRHVRGFIICTGWPLTWISFRAPRVEKHRRIGDSTARRRLKRQTYPPAPLPPVATVRKMATTRSLALLSGLALFAAKGSQAVIVVPPCPIRAQSQSAQPDVHSI